MRALDLFARLLLWTTLLVIADAGADADGQIADFRSFVSDRAARAPGDTLTVLISELASISATAASNLKKDDKGSAGIQSPALGTRQWGGELGTEFTGGGRIERGGKFIAKLAVTVDSIDLQGNLHIHGEQEIAVNRERQKIRLNGIVRQEDLSADNTISSWRIRDAKIEFVGSGDLSKQQSPGIITRIFSWLGLL